MARPTGPLFVARDAYRRRRLADAARLWPLLGLFLFLLPMLWNGQDGRVLQTAYGGLYLFAVWSGLILGAFLLARRLGRGAQPLPAVDPPPAEGSGE